MKNHDGFRLRVIDVYCNCIFIGVDVEPSRKVKCVISCDIYINQLDPVWLSAQPRSSFSNSLSPCKMLRMSPLFRLMKTKARRPGFAARPAARASLTDCRSNGGVGQCPPSCPKAMGTCGGCKALTKKGKRTFFGFCVYFLKKPSILP